MGRVSLQRRHERFHCGAAERILLQRRGVLEKLAASTASALEINRRCSATLHCPDHHQPLLSVDQHLYLYRLSTS